MRSSKAVPTTPLTLCLPNSASNISITIKGSNLTLAERLAILHAMTRHFSELCDDIASQRQAFASKSAPVRRSKGPTSKLSLTETTDSGHPIILGEQSLPD